MTSGAVEKEILELENRYWTAMKNKDVEGAMALTDFPCMVAGAPGVGRIDAETYRKMMTGAKWTLHGFELKDPHVKLLDDDVAVVIYKIHEDMTVEGEEVALDASDSSVWVRRDGRWRCSVHTESVAGDPYGRDRKKP